MYTQKSYQEYVEKYPDQPFTQFLIRFFSAKPDLTELDKASKECEESMKAERDAYITEKRAEIAARKAAEQAQMEAYK